MVWTNNCEFCGFDSNSCVCELSDVNDDYTDKELDDELEDFEEE